MDRAGPAYGSREPLAIFTQQTFRMVCLIFAQGAVEPSYRHGTFVGLGLIAVVPANTRCDYDISRTWAGH